MTKDEAIKLALEAAYLAGWNASGEGYNAEYPFGDHARNPEEDAVWIKDRDNALREALAAPVQQEPGRNHWEDGDVFERIAAMKTQPAQQEPVGEAYLCDKCHTPFDGCWYCPECNHNTATKELVYTSPQPAQRKPLTDDEIWKFWWSRPEVPEGEDDSMEAEFVAAVRRVLAAHGIKENT